MTCLENQFWVFLRVAVLHTGFTVSLQISLQRTWAVSTLTVTFHHLQRREGGGGGKHTNQLKFGKKKNKEALDTLQLIRKHQIT